MFSFLAFRYTHTYVNKDPDVETHTLALKTRRNKKVLILTDLFVEKDILLGKFKFSSLTQLLINSIQ